MLVALPFGLRASCERHRLVGVIICLLALGISAASYAMGLILKDEDGFAPFIQGVSLPLLLLSGVLLPMSLAPAWLRHTSQVNPLTYVVDATRALFRGDFGDRHVWIGALVTVALGALLGWWGTRTFAAAELRSPRPDMTTAPLQRQRRRRRCAGSTGYQACPLRNVGRGPRQRCRSPAPTHLCVVGSPRGCPFVRAGRCPLGAGPP